MSKEKVSLVDGTCAERFSRPVEQLGQDEHGTWLGARRSTASRRSTAAASSPCPTVYVSITQNP